MSKVIVITGSGEGLGRAIARRVAKDGDIPVLLARRLDKVQAVADELGNGAFAVACDVGEPDSVRAAFAEIAKRHASIDVLINNAGIYEPFTVAKASDAQIQNIAQTNYIGPIFTCRSALAMMGHGAHIINVSSESVDVNFPMMTLYRSSKAALEHFTNSLRAEVEGQGIRVTIVRAGPMIDDDKAGSNWPPEIAQQFYQACAANGLNLMTRPISHVNSNAEVVRHIINLPPDLHVPIIAFEGQKQQ